MSKSRPNNLKVIGGGGGGQPAQRPEMVEFLNSDAKCEIGF